VAYCGREPIVDNKQITVSRVSKHTHTHTHTEEEEERKKRERERYIPLFYSRICNLGFRSFHISGSHGDDKFVQQRQIKKKTIRNTHTHSVFIICLCYYLEKE
jgi:hypothetical protein